MNEDFNSRAWADGHHRLSFAIDKFLRRTAKGFARLNDRQFAAPWRSKPTRCA